MKEEGTERLEPCQQLSLSIKNGKDEAFEMEKDDEDKEGNQSRSLFDAIGGEDLYNDFSELSALDVDLGNDGDTSVASVGASGTAAQTNAPGSASGNVPGVEVTSESTKTTECSNIADDSNQTEDAKEEDSSDSDVDEDVEIIIGAAVSTSAKRFNRRNSLGNRARNSWKRSDHVLSTDAPEGTSKVAVDEAGDSTEGDGASTAPVEAEDPGTTKSRYKSAFAGASVLESKALDDDDVEYDPCLQ